MINQYEADAETVTDDQHADHELRIYRGAAGVAVIRGQMLAHLRSKWSWGTTSSRLKE